MTRKELENEEVCNIQYVINTLLIAINNNIVYFFVCLFRVPHFQRAVSVQ